MSLQILQSQPSTNFTWFFLEYLYPNVSIEKINKVISHSVKKGYSGLDIFFLIPDILSGRNDVMLDKVNLTLASDKTFF